MNKITKIGLVIISIGIGGASLLGGISLINIGIDINNEEPEPVSAEELSEQSDIENRDEGLRAMENGDFLSALAYFHAISNESRYVSNKSELLQDAAIGYLTDILGKTDEELDYDNFDQAKIYLEEAISLMPDNSELSQAYNHVLLREQLYNIVQTDTAEEVLRFIQEHTEEIGNDTYVVKMFAEYRDIYIDDIIQRVNDLIAQSDYEGARQIVNLASEVIGTYDELEKIQKQIQREEIKAQVEYMIDQEQWRELILYLDGNPAIKADYKSQYNSAFNNYKNDIIDQAEEAIAVYDYEQVKSILVSAQDILDIDEEFMELYNQYKDYSSNVFRFCPIINNQTIEYGDAQDISGTEYSNVIKIKHNKNEKTIVFRLPAEKYSRLSGKLFICQDKNYSYDDKDTGETIVSFYSENENFIQRYEGITYMNSVSFDIPVSNVQYLTVKVKKTTSRNVILGIREGYLTY